MEGDMTENYGTFFDELIKHEGGFTDDERDPGNQRPQLSFCAFTKILVRNAHHRDTQSVLSLAATNFLGQIG
jgi:hypothetical protein